MAIHKKTFKKAIKVNKKLQSFTKLKIPKRVKNITGIIIRESKGAPKDLRQMHISELKPAKARMAKQTKKIISKRNVRKFRKVIRKIGKPMIISKNLRKVGNVILPKLRKQAKKAKKVLKSGHKSGHKKIMSGHK